MCNFSFKTQRVTQKKPAHKRALRKLRKRFKSAAYTDVLLGCETRLKILMEASGALGRREGQWALGVTEYIKVFLVSHH